MAATAKTFRVFVSSTFSDLKAERNALQERVFPELRRLAADHGSRFQAIDLRWGVSKEASIDQQTMNICLGEIGRCQKVTPRPNFLVLMGDRYGWMPPPPQIPADEFERILAVLNPNTGSDRSQDRRRLLLWEEGSRESEKKIKMVKWDAANEAYVGDKGWYRRDNNAEPAEYALQPWKGYSYEEWGEIEKDLHSALSQGASKAGLKEETLFKYWSSATHQEIDAGALRIREAPEHVHCFFREIEGFPSAFSAEDFMDDLDQRLADEYPDGLPEPAFDGYIAEIKRMDPAANAREVNDSIESMLADTLKYSLEREFLEQVQGWLVDFSGKDFLNLMDNDWKLDQDAFDRQKELKKELKAKVPGNIKDDYKAKWTGRGITTDHIDQLCEDVYEALSGIILSEIDEPHLASTLVEEMLIQTDDALKDEGAAHRAFAEERLAYFVGRTEILGKIADYMNSSERRSLAVFGKGGTGKSALVAKALQQAQAAHEGSEIVYRFIGATPGSSDGRSLLASLCREISRRYGASESDIPLDYQDLLPEFGKRMALAIAERPLIMFLDSLDQLSPQHGARNLTWLPDTLPEHVRVIVTTRKEEDTFDRLQAKKAILEELGGLSDEEGDKLLSDWLADAGRTKDTKRTLQDAQRKEVLDKFIASEGAPLYLKLAFEEARLWSSGDGMPPESLEPGIESIIEYNLIDRLADESSHGVMLVSKVLGYLAASRYGLAEDEMIDLLSRDLQMYEWFFKKSWHLPADLVRWAIQYRRNKAAGPNIEGPEADRDEERAALDWLREIRNPPEEVSIFLKKVLPKPEGPKLPVVLWSRLSLDLEPYLSERTSEGTTLLTFYHRELNDVSKSVYLDDGNEQRHHEKLADYFRFRSDPDWDREWKGKYPRGLSELPYHLTEAKMWDDVFKTLTDFRFLENKAAEVGVLESKDEDGNPVNTYTGVFQLQEDYERVLAAMPGGEGASEGEHSLIVTAVDRGNGLTVYCPVCNETSTIEENQKDSVITCPQSDCDARLKINPFVTKMAQEN